MACWPFAFAAAAGLGVVLAPLRPWMLAISGALLIFGLVQLYRRGASCQRRSNLSRRSSYQASPGQPPLAEMDARPREALRAEFNTAKGGYCVIALFPLT